MKPEPSTIICTGWMRSACCPCNFVVTDIQPAPSDFAGATLATNGGYPRQRTSRQIHRAGRSRRALADHPRHRHAELDAFWQAANRSDMHQVSNHG